MGTIGRDKLPRNCWTLPSKKRFTFSPLATGSPARWPCPGGTTTREVPATKAEDDEFLSNALLLPARKHVERATRQTGASSRPGPIVTAGPFQSPHWGRVCRTRVSLPAGWRRGDIFGLGPAARGAKIPWRSPPAEPPVHGPLHGPIGAAMAAARPATRLVGGHGGGGGDRLRRRCVAAGQADDKLGPVPSPSLWASIWPWCSSTTCLAR